MSRDIDGKTKRIGLALSGGGFRAAAFHLGVFRQLESIGLLWKIDLLSCVSGGSIAGAFLAANWGKADTLDRLERYLKTKSIAVSSVLRGVLDPFATRLDELAKSYDRDLFDDMPLNSLKKGPRIYLNATNLSTGNAFFFVAGENKPSEMGEWEFDFVPAEDFRISKAVAASSAFPPVFPPLLLEQDVYGTAQAEYVTLSDGGIYDNLGMNPLLRMERNRLDYAIVSDAGKPFAIDITPTEVGTGVLFEAIGILMEQARGLQFSRLELSWKAKNGPKPIWFSIDSELGQINAGDAAFASAIGTNLKKLKEAEFEVLRRHGGALLEHRLRTYTPELFCTS